MVSKQYTVVKGEESFKQFNNKKYENYKVPLSN